MAVSFRYETGSLATFLSTELNSLAAGSDALQNLGTNPAYDNTNGYLWGDIEVYVTYPTAPTAGKTVDIYLSEAVDGGNYADLASGVLPPNHLLGSVPLRNVNTAQRLVLRGVPLPPCVFKLLAHNGADQALASSGNTVRLLPYREQGV
jgi:hypothetical protein